MCWTGPKGGAHERDCCQFGRPLGASADQAGEVNQNHETTAHLPQSDPSWWSALCAAGVAGGAAGGEGVDAVAGPLEAGQQPSAGERRTSAGNIGAISAHAASVK